MRRTYPTWSCSRHFISCYPWILDLFIHVSFQLPGEYAALQPFGICNLSHTVQSWSFIPEWSEACGEEKSYTKRGLSINVRQRLLQSDTGYPGPFCLYVHKSGLKPDSFNFICKAIRSHHCATSLSRWVLLLPSTSREPTTE